MLRSFRGFVVRSFVGWTCFVFWGGYQGVQGSVWQQDSHPTQNPTEAMLAQPAQPSDEEPAAAPAIPQIPDQPRSVEPSEFLVKPLTEAKTVDLKSASYIELAEWLKQELGLTILVQQRELEGDGIMLGDSVSDWLDDKPVYLLLDRLELNGIGWYFENDVLYLTTTKIVEDRQITTPYHLGELLDSGYPAWQIVEIIESTIQPNFWEDAGGPGRINLVGDMIFVRNSQAIHRKVQALLLGLQNHGRQTFLDMPQANIALQDRLSEPVNVHFRDTPLDEAIAELARQTGADIRLDRASLRGTRIRDRQPVSLQIEERPLALVLDFLLGELTLDWQIRHGVLWITKKRESQEIFHTAIYDVRDLCANRDEAAGLSYALQAQLPDVWDVDGGEASLQFAKPEVMVVWASAATHAQLLDLLEKYRLALKNSKIRQVSPEEDEIQTLYYRLNANVAQDLFFRIPNMIEPHRWIGQEGPDAVGRIMILESKPDTSAEVLKSVAAETIGARKVLVIEQRQSIHEKISEFIYRVENGDPVSPKSSGGMGGGMGGMGFGGGMFSRPVRGLRGELGN